MEIAGATVADTFAEAFRMWAARLVVTAADAEALEAAVAESRGYATSVIGCDAEGGLEGWLDPERTLDGRPGASLLFFSFKPEPLEKAIRNRVAQCLMTAPTTAVYDGMPEAGDTDATQRLAVGKSVRYFGDGFQQSKLLDGRRFWRIPVMEGEFVVEASIGSAKAIAGGNVLIGAPSQAAALAAARAAVSAIAPCPETITPFPGGIVRSGSKVGSQYAALFASTNDAHCPTLRGATESELPEDVNAVYEIVVNGLGEAPIADALRAGIHAACEAGASHVSAGNYGGKLGKFHFHLHELLA